MAKRELSSTLRNLKFMQRAAQREEKTQKEEEVAPDGNFPSISIPKKCIVIMEGDPHPGAIKGRMSFQSFNPAIDKLNEEEANLYQPLASAISSGNQSETISTRESALSRNGSDGPKVGDFDSNMNGDLKRKQAEDVSEAQYPNKFQKNIQGDEESSPHGNRKSHKQLKHEKLDWSVLRPPKSQSKKK